jgi:hypothetical protein
VEEEEEESSQELSREVSKAPSLARPGEPSREQRSDSNPHSSHTMVHIRLAPPVQPR